MYIWMCIDLVVKCLLNCLMKCDFYIYLAADICLLT